MERKGIILAGGLGTRLYPATKVISKQLLPIFDKPMIYYPLSTLMIAGIRNILIISTSDDIPLFKKLLGNGSELGIKIEYKIQLYPNGIAEALIIAEDFLNGNPSALILGDNIFYGHALKDRLIAANKDFEGATIFAYHVKNPSRFGVVQFDKDRLVTCLEEKPLKPKSNFAVTGLYFYDAFASKYANKLKPSNRGELEITDLNKLYLDKQKLKVEIMTRGYAWLDTGTHESLIDAHMYVQTIEKRQGQKIACLEEISLRNGWISSKKLFDLANAMQKNNYREYLFQLYEEQKH